MIDLLTFDLCSGLVPAQGLARFEGRGVGSHDDLRDICEGQQDVRNNTIYEIMGGDGSLLVRSRSEPGRRKYLLRNSSFASANAW